MLGGRLLSYAQSAESKVLSISLSYSAHQNPSKHLGSELLSTVLLRSELLLGSVAFSPAMDFMKVLGQTVRKIKREVNLKVLKVTEIEQKVLDATSDEPWGPHGSALSELSHATKKFTECQMIMIVLWIRVGDTSANWRHIYKALAVIEYLIANGSERAVDVIMGHSYQIVSLSGF